MDSGGAVGLHIGAGLVTGLITGTVTGASGEITPWHKPVWQGALIGGSIGLIIGLTSM